MPLNKSRGQMYPWVSHMHSHLRGKCPHGCSYCYVQAHERRWNTGAFAGPLRLDESQLRVRYGKGKSIFIEHQNDLFAEEVPERFIRQIADHCCQYRENQYVFQTKNPLRLAQTLGLPNDCLVGVTVETNRTHPQMGRTPSPENRMLGCLLLKEKLHPSRTFITIEPIMDFDLAVLLGWLGSIGPGFVNIGADSKGHKLPEPKPAKIAKLIEGIGKLGIEIREKHNLGRLLGDEMPEGKP